MAEYRMQRESPVESIAGLVSVPPMGAAWTARIWTRARKIAVPGIAVWSVPDLSAVADVVRTLSECSGSRWWAVIQRSISCSTGAALSPLEAAAVRSGTLTDAQGDSWRWMTFDELEPVLRWVPRAWAWTDGGLMIGSSEDFTTITLPVDAASLGFVLASDAHADENVAVMCRPASDPSERLVSTLQQAARREEKIIANWSLRIGLGER